MRSDILKVVAVSSLSIIFVVAASHVINTRYLTEPDYQPVTSVVKPPAKTVVAIGDMVCSPETEQDVNNCQMQSVADSVKLANPDAVFMLGDLQYDKGEPVWFEKVFDKYWGELKSKSYPVPGNHEYKTANAQGYFGYWNSGGDQRVGAPDKGYYSFNIGTWHVVALNSNCEYVSCDDNSEQLQWLREDLKSNSTKCTLAFWHHPVFTSGRYQNDNNSKSRGKNFWKVLDSAGAEIILNGHDHIYERFGLQNSDGVKQEIRGIREFIVGTGGRSKYPMSKTITDNQEFGDDSNFGYLKLYMNETNYNWQFITTEGKILDSGREACHD